MKVKPKKKQENLKPKKRSKKKHSKPTENKLSVNLFAKKSNGIANWNQLAKVIEYDVKKPKMPTLPVKASNQELRKPNVKTTPESTSSSAQAKNAWHESGSTLAQKLRKSVSRNSDTTTNGYSEHRDPPSRLKKTAPESARASVKTNGVMKTSGSSGGAHPVDLSRGYTNLVAMDCEMVGTGPGGKDSMLARVSIVNKFGDCIYDTYVKPMDDITDFRTAISGIRPSDLVNGKDLYTVQTEVLEILQGRILIGHALKNDLDVLFMSHPKSMTRDTARYRPFRELFEGRTPSLKKLTQKLLGVDIQSGEHSSVEDAQAAMQIYLMHRSEWERHNKYRKKRKNSKKKNGVPESTVTMLKVGNTIDDT